MNLRKRLGRLEDVLSFVRAEAGDIYKVIDGRSDKDIYMLEEALLEKYGTLNGIIFIQIGVDRGLPRNEPKSTDEVQS
jgi:hypothetical protein